jgi:hypothetical protein
MNIARLAVTAIMCSGCQPADIIINYYGETAGESESSDSESTGDPVPDLPPDMPAETETETETGDGDGDGDPGDGDGDEPDHTALIVESAGEPIGYLVDVWEYGFIVWDDGNSITFKINAQTGNLAQEVYPSPGLYIFHTLPDCGGLRYVAAEFANGMNCEDVPAPAMRPIYVNGGSISGHIPADHLETTIATSFVIVPQSLSHPAGVCYENMSPTCAFEVMPTDVIPVTFPLPITVEEAVAP